MICYQTDTTQLKNEQKEGKTIMNILQVNQPTKTLFHYYHK